MSYENGIIREIVGRCIVEVGGFEGAELVGDGKAEVEQAPTEKAVEACCGFEQSHIWGLKFEAVVKEFPLVVLSEKSAPHRIHLEERLGLGPRRLPEREGRGVVEAEVREEVGGEGVWTDGEEGVAEEVKGSAGARQVEHAAVGGVGGDEAGLREEVETEVAGIAIVLRKHSEVGDVARWDAASFRYTGGCLDGEVAAVVEAGGKVGVREESGERSEGRAKVERTCIVKTVLLPGEECGS